MSKKKGNTLGTIKSPASLLQVGSTVLIGDSLLLVEQLLKEEGWVTAICRSMSGSTQLRVPSSRVLEVLDVRLTPTK